MHIAVGEGGAHSSCPYGICRASEARCRQQIISRVSPFVPWCGTYGSLLRAICSMQYAHCGRRGLKLDFFFVSVVIR